MRKLLGFTVSQRGQKTEVPLGEAELPADVKLALDKYEELRAKAKEKRLDKAEQIDRFWVGFEGPVFDSIRANLNAKNVTPKHPRIKKFLDIVHMARPTWYASIAALANSNEEFKEDARRRIDLELKKENPNVDGLSRIPLQADHISKILKKLKDSNSNPDWADWARDMLMYHTVFMEKSGHKFDPKKHVGECLDLIEARWDGVTGDMKQRNDAWNLARFIVDFKPISEDSELQKKAEELKKKIKALPPK